MTAGAQNQDSMRSMAVNQLYQYAQAIYDRGDYPQAATIFSRILSMDPAHSGARSYAAKLNKQGEQIAIPSMPVAVIVEPIIVTPPKMVKKTVEPSKEEAPKQEVKATYNNEDLKKDLQDADQSIAELKDQVAALRNQISQGQKEFSQ